MAIGLNHVRRCETLERKSLPWARHGQWLICSGRLRPLERIEAVFETVLDALNDERDELCLTLYKRPAVNTRGTSTELHRDAVLPGVKTRRICFPGKSAEEAWRFGKLTEMSRELRLTIST